MRILMPAAHSSCQILLVCPPHHVSIDSLFWGDWRFYITGIWVVQSCSTRSLVAVFSWNCWWSICLPPLQSVASGPGPGFRWGTYCRPWAGPVSCPGPSLHRLPPSKCLWEIQDAHCGSAARQPLKILIETRCSACSWSSVMTGSLALAGGVRKGPSVTLRRSSSTFLMQIIPLLVSSW
jgi:hypothetical protein